MEITHELLLSLGFAELYNRSTRYTYKGLTGRLGPEPGSFHFHGFGLAITTVTDLKYMLMMVDYQLESSFVAYPNNFN